MKEITPEQIAKLMDKFRSIYPNGPRVYISDECRLNFETGLIQGLAMCGVPDPGALVDAGRKELEKMREKAQLAYLLLPDSDL